MFAALIAAPAAFAQDGTTTPEPVAPPHVTSRAKLEPSQATSYDNKFEVYGGLSFMNGQAGQNLPKRYNLGGGEGMLTYWVGPHLGVAGDYRWEGGTTPVLPLGAAFGFNRVKVTQNIFAGGVQWRGPKNRYAAVDYHALFGASKGVFDSATLGFPGGSPLTAQQLGLYPNTTTPWGAVGGSLDFNYKPNLAIRLSPDMIFEHFGTELREFVSVSGGVVYRFGHR
jgi:hypothetical protein